MLWRKKNDIKHADTEDATHNAHQHNARVVEASPVKSSAIDFADIIAEADVYWTYGKWHDALVLYRWWMESDGAGSPFDSAASSLQMSIAEKAVDCSIRAKDSEFSMELLNILKASKYPEDFILTQSILSLKGDPKNFKLIQFCNQFDGVEETIKGIIEYEKVKEETVREKKDRMWKKSALDANRLSTSHISTLSWYFVDHGIDILKHLGACMENSNIMNDIKATGVSDVSDLDMTIISNMVGISALGDDSAGAHDPLDNEVFSSVKQSMYDELEIHPENLGIHVELLKILHDYGLTEEYSVALLRLVSVLQAYSAGNSLKRRLLSAGKILGYSPLWDILSGQMSGVESIGLNGEYRVYMTEKFKHRLLPSINVVECIG